MARSTSTTCWVSCPSSWATCPDARHGGGGDGRWRSALAVVLASIRVLRVPVLDQLVQGFVSFFRGTPLLVQLFLFYYGLPQVIPRLQRHQRHHGRDPGPDAPLRGLHGREHPRRDPGRRPQPVGGAAAVGMTQLQALRRIILPQAARIAAPTLLNYFIDMIKSTSLAFTLGVTEMMGAAQKEAAGSFRYFEAFLLVAMHLLGRGGGAVASLQRRLEVRLGRAFADTRDDRGRGPRQALRRATVLDGIDLDIRPASGSR